MASALWADRTDEEIRQAPFTEEDARLVYAREHGFETWDDLISRVTLLASRTDTVPTEPFMAAFAALQSGNVVGFEAVLRANPRMVNERGTNGNTVLNLAVSFASKRDWKGGLSAIEALLAGGSDVNDANDRAGHHSMELPTRTNRELRTSCLRKARPWMPKRTARGALRWSLRCSGGIARSPICLRAMR
jgi:ankyrin repeat protein